MTSMLGAAGKGQLVDYDRVVVVAPAWRETLDKKTRTLYIRADFSSLGFCETIITPIPGTKPQQYTYDCLPVICEGKCELLVRTLPDGTIVYYCECPDAKATKVRGATAKSGSAGGKTAAKKPRGKKNAPKSKRQKKR